jgi:hypothetical protein
VYTQIRATVAFGIQIRINKRHLLLVSYWTKNKKEMNLLITKATFASLASAQRAVVHSNAKGKQMMLWSFTKRA